MIQPGLPLQRSPHIEQLADGVTCLRCFADSAALLPLIDTIASAAPWRHLITPGGGRMSVSMTNCGRWGWHSDTTGYRYVDHDPLTNWPWPVMPPLLQSLALDAAARAGFPGFEPDCALINRYEVGAQMGAHRDYDELEMRHPIVSVSLGIPAAFLWYGARRSSKPSVISVEDGDVIVWGGDARAGYHAIRRLKPATHPLTGALRYNLTFRRAK